MSAHRATYTPLRALRRDRADPRSALDPETATWIAAPAAMALVVLAMVVLGPGLGRLLLAPAKLRYWPELLPLVHPEPTEHARFLIALTAPAVLAAMTLLAARTGAALTAATARRLMLAAQAAFVAVLLACFAIQLTYRYSGEYVFNSSAVRWFLPSTLAVAAAIAAALVAGARSERVRVRFASWTAESRGRRAGAWLIALAVLAATLLPAIITDSSVLLSDEGVSYHLQFTFDETMAVIDGRSPLGNFAAQYSSLWPYVVAAPLRLVGASVLSFTLAMAFLTGAAMLGLFDVLRRLTHSTLAALPLFLPLLATSAYRLHSWDGRRFSLINYFGTLPLRYAGPLLLAWLLARHLDGARPRRAWPLLLAGGLVAINNVDFGIPALAATTAALVWARLPLTRAELRGLAADAAIGLGGALALVCGLLLLRTGALPDFSLAFRYARVFAQGGFAMLPIVPRAGMSTIIFLTFLAALASATARTMRRDPDRLLTALLAWSGIFGLGAGSYYVGRSIPEGLTNLFPIWALALVLLTLVVVRRLARPGAGRPALPDLACLLGFGALVCSLAQTPAPWTELHRISGHAAPVFRVSPAQPFVAAHVREGEHVALLMQLGHRIADNLGIHDVSPYTGPDSMKTLEQLEETLQLLSAERGRKVFVAFLPRFNRIPPPGLPQALEAYGLRLQAHASTKAGAMLQLWELR
jgi:hypothetical protein